MPRMTGSQYLAEVIKRQGATHVFFKPTIILETMAALGNMAAGTLGNCFARSRLSESEDVAMIRLSRSRRYTVRSRAAWSRLEAARR